jgi:hypothetical protein
VATPTSQDPQDKTETEQDTAQVITEADQTDDVSDPSDLSDSPEPEGVDPAEPVEDSATDEVESDTAEQIDAEPSDTEQDEDDLAPETDSEPDADDIEEILADADASEEPSDLSDDAPLTETPSAEPQIVRETVVERKGGFVPMLLGGVIAAGLGFGAAQVMGPGLLGGNAFEAEARDTIAAQADQIATLEAGLAEARAALAALDLAPVSNSVAAVQDSLGGMQDGIAALQDQSAQFDSRLTAVEKEGLAGAVGPEAIAAYERELEELRGAIAGQRAAIETQKTEMLAMAEQALAAESSAEEKAQLAAARNALGALVSAVQNGQPFEGPLADLQANGVAVPAELADFAADGVPSATALLSEFPPLARKALRDARDAVSAEESGGITGFLTARLGARSVAPREGDDVDAVLSRAEAAAKAGDLNSALTELQALPEEASTVLADWVARATSRNQALSAAAALGQELNK